jgi:hypothetical protein
MHLIRPLIRRASRLTCDASLQRSDSAIPLDKRGLHSAGGIANLDRSRRLGRLRRGSNFAHRLHERFQLRCGR